MNNDNGIQCPICKIFIFENLIGLTCKYGIHYICGGCFDDLKIGYQKKCPTCQGTISVTPEKIETYKLIGNSQLELMQNLKVTCPNEGCEKKIKYKKLNDHLTNNCIFETKQCKYCNNYIEKNKYKKHKKRCNKDIDCEFCGETTKNFKLSKHYIQCPDYEITCQNEGCKEIIKRKKQDKHNKSCKHFLIACDKNTCNMSFKRKYEKKHKKECLGIEAKCEYCDIYFLRGILNEHYNICPEMSINCEWCKKEIKRKKYTTHLETKCKKIEIKCTKCYKMYIKKKAIDHKKICKAENTQCKLCGKVYIKIYRNKHFLIECLNRKIKCICGKLIKKKDMDSHKEECTKYLHFCNSCQNYYTLSDKEHEKIHKTLRKKHKEFEENKKKPGWLEGKICMLLMKTLNQNSLTKIQVLGSGKKTVYFKIIDRYQDSYYYYIRGKNWKSFIFPLGNETNNSFGDYLTMKDDDQKKIYQIKKIDFKNSSAKANELTVNGVMKYKRGKRYNYGTTRNYCLGGYKISKLKITKIKTTLDKETLKKIKNNERRRLDLDDDFDDDE